MKYLFLDTNILLHYLRFEDILEDSPEYDG